MEAIFRTLCETHGIRSISVTWQHNYALMTVYLHTGSADDGVAHSGGGETFDAAFANALTDMKSKVEQTGTLEAAE